MRKALIALMALALAGCGREEEAQPEPQPRFYVLGNLSGQVLTYLPDEDTVLDRVDVGQAPNSAVYDGEYLYVVNSLSSTISVLEPGLPPAPVKDVVLQEGDNPWDADTLGGALFVSASASGLLYEINNLEPFDVLRVGKWPEGVASFGGKIWVACSGFDNSEYDYDTAALYVYDPSSKTLDSLVFGEGVNLQDVIGYGDYVYALGTGDYAARWGVLYKVDPEALRVVDSLSFPNHSPGILELKGDTLVITGWDGTVFFVEPASFSILDSLQLDEGIMGAIPYPGGIAFTRFSSASENWLLFVEGGELVDSAALGLGVGAGEGVYLEE